MVDPSQLPYLIELLDDEDPQVRSVVAARLADFGPRLRDELARLPDALPEARIRAIQDIVLDMSSGDAPLIRAILYEPGELVAHRRYGYRGVVVSTDISCQATDAWYARNRTKPARHQPWYHVLVHDSDDVTYAAQTSLRADVEPARVEHPLVRYFFSTYVDGRHVRNARAWPDDMRP